MISIIIPTLNAAETLPRTLRACQVDPAFEIIVVDGGSTDKTCDIARQSGVTLIETSAGRGRQLKIGGDAAKHQYLFFLHADTVPDDGWHTLVKDFVNNGHNRFRAAVFKLRLDDPSKSARRIEFFVRWRTRLLGLPYGDQGLVISRAYYQGIGGFRPYPLMEDVDIMRKIGRATMVILPCYLTTSAIRYQRDGYWKRPLKNLGLLTLFYLGVPPKFLARLY